MFFQYRECILRLVVEGDIGARILHNRDLVGSARGCNNFDMRRDGLDILDNEAKRDQSASRML